MQCAGAPAHRKVYSFAITTRTIKRTDLNIGDVVTFPHYRSEARRGSSTQRRDRSERRKQPGRRRQSHGPFPHPTTSALICGEGHESMLGEFSVQIETVPPDMGPRY
jgi:hypothetical protein